MRLGPNQRKWIEALRSGQYRQGKGMLCVGGRYCCLGVACNVVLGDPVGTGYQGEKVWGDSFHQSVTSFPIHMIDQIGLRDNGGQGLDGKCLITMNDQGVTFAQIADAIESDPANWFTAPK